MSGVLKLLIYGLKIVITSPSFPQCVERESRGLKTQTGCPIENFGHDRQIEMILHSIMRLLTIPKLSDSFLSLYFVCRNSSFSVTSEE